MISIAGIGTTLYGKKDVGSQNRSYIATKWFVWLLLPIFPLGSYRVWLGKGYLRGVFSRREYRMLKVKFDWEQVIKTYLIFWVGFVVAPLSLLHFFFNKNY